MSSSDPRETSGAPCIYAWQALLMSIARQALWRQRPAGDLRSPNLHPLVLWSYDRLMVGTRGSSEGSSRDWRHAQHSHPVHPLGGADIGCRYT